MTEENVNETEAEETETEETAEPTAFDVANEALDADIENGASEEDMIVTLIQSGFKFAQAGRLMKQVLEYRGLRLSNKDRFAAVEECLTNWEFSPESWDDVQEAINNLVEEIDNTTPKQALAALKKFAKENEIELPEKPKGAGGGARVNAFDKFFSYALENREATDDDIVAFCNSLGATEKQAAKYAKRFQGIMKFATDFAG